MSGAAEQLARLVMAAVCPRYQRVACEASTLQVRAHGRPSNASSNPSLQWLGKSHCQLQVLQKTNKQTATNNNNNNNNNTNTH